MDSNDNTIRKECWRYSINCLGKSHIFTNRVRFYRLWITLISVSGVLVPVLVGGIALTYGADNKILIVALWIAAPFSLIQLILSTISLSLKWDDRLGYSMESATANRALSDEFKKLAQFPPEDVNHKFEILLEREKARSEQDDKYGFSRKEERKGMRYTLYINQKPCATCERTPISMEPTPCETCGKF